MSNEAITWALAQKVDRSSAKFVLVAMANCAGEEMTCWPSVQYLVDATCQDRKTVLENLKRLRDCGFIVATGEHKGRTGQVCVYMLKSPEIGTSKESQKRAVPKTVPVPISDAKSPVFPIEESRFSVETDPKTGHGTQKEPSKETKGKPNKRATLVVVDDVIPAGIPAEPWADFVAHRRAMKSVPFTDAAKKGVIRDVLKFVEMGYDATDLLQTAVTRGWRTVFEPRGQQGGNSGPFSAAGSNTARNAELLREKLFGGAL